MTRYNPTISSRYHLQIDLVGRETKFEIGVFLFCKSAFIHKTLKEELPQAAFLCPLPSVLKAHFHYKNEDDPRGLLNLGSDPLWEAILVSFCFREVVSKS